MKQLKVFQLFYNLYMLSNVENKYNRLKIIYHFSEMCIFTLEYFICINLQGKVQLRFFSHQIPPYKVGQVLETVQEWWKW